MMLNLVTALQQQAKGRPHAIAVCFYPNENSNPVRLSFLALHQQAMNLSIELLKFTQHKQQEKIVIALPNGIDFWIAFFACAYAGICAIPSYVPKPNSRKKELKQLRTIAKLTNSQCLISHSSDQLAEEKLLSNYRHVLIDHVDHADHITDNKILNSVNVSPNDLAMLLFTSGSTGSPKGVMITHGMISHNYQQFIDTFNLDQQSHGCCWLPNCHIAGFYMRTLSIMTGASCFELSAQMFLQHPASWLKIIVDNQIHISTAPAFAYDLLCHEQVKVDNSWDFSHWKLAVTGGEVVTPKTFNTFNKKFMPYGLRADSFTPFYGMTETLCTSVRHPYQPLPSLSLSRKEIRDHQAVLVNTTEDAEGIEDTIDILSCGQILGDIQVKIADPELSRFCDDMMIGEVLVKGKNVTTGYWQSPEHNQNQQIFIQQEGPFFPTGDLGFKSNNELFITGRVKDLIIIHGINHYPKDIEDSLMSIAPNDWVICAFAVAVQQNEGLALAIEATDISTVQINLLHQQLLKQHGLRLQALVQLPMHGLPRTSTNKIQRSLCRQKLEMEEWKNLLQQKPTPTQNKQTPATTNHALKQLYQQLAFILDRPMSDFSAEQSIQALGIDSIDSVKLIHELGKRGFQVGLSDLYEELTLDIFAQRMNRQVARTTDFEERILFEQVKQQLPLPLPTFSSSIQAFFVTGVTGFLGAYLLRSLLQQSNAKITCLVRASNTETGKQRVLTALQQLSHYNPDWATRLDVVIGSLDKKRFALDDKTFQKLAMSVDSIIHNAANVNFVAPYEALRQTNVLSNQYVIELATTHKTKSIHYISTVAVFNSHERDQFSLIEEHHQIANPQHLFSGYAQTKWMSEALYQSVRQAGIPVTFYRPALVMGDNENGYCHTDDFLCRFLKGCLQMQAFPDLAVEIDMTPVNYVADAIVQLALDEQATQDAYHFVNPAPYTLRQLAQWYQQQGYIVNLMPEQQWHESLTMLDASNAMYPVIPFLLEKSSITQESILPFFAKRGLNISTQATQQDLKHKQCPPVSDQLLRCYTDYFINTHFLPAP